MAYRIRATTTGVWILVLLVLGHGLVGLPQIYHMTVYHESPLTVNTYRHCTMLTCIDWTRQCSRGNLNASVYVYPFIPTTASYLGAVASPEYDSLLDRVRASRFYTSNPTEACLFIPPFSNLCVHNRCLPTHTLLPASFHALPFWSHGRNHILLEISDEDTSMFDGELALIARSSFGFDTARVGFDVAIPLVPENRNPSVYKAAIAGNITSRPLLFYFQGKMTTKFRAQLVELHDPARGQVSIVTGVLGAAKEHDFLDSMVHARFALVVIGQGRHTYRLLESLAAGAVPVIISDDWVLPFHEEISWSTCAVFVPQRRVLDVPRILRAISDEEVEKRETACAHIQDSYFSEWTYASAAISMLEYLERRFRRIEPPLSVL